MRLFLLFLLSISLVGCGLEFGTTKGNGHFNRCSANNPELEDSPLLLASALGNDSRIVALLNLGEDINQTGGSAKTTALICAIENNHTEAAKLLLKEGANPDQTDGARTSPLIFATASENVVIINVLLRDYNADPNVKNNAGFTALHYSVTKSVVVLRIIATHPTTNPNINDHKGNTPLELAAFNGNLSQVRILLDNRARAKEVNLLHVADLQVKELLRAHGATEEFNLLPTPLP